MLWNYNEPMIGYIAGKLVGKAKNYLIIDTGGVGYRVSVTPDIFLSAKTGDEFRLFTHNYVREDQLALYGFATIEALDFFELLLTVSGVGPKVAMSIMSLSDIPMIKSAILNNDPDVFTKVSGVGRKTAELLIMELKEKIGNETGITPGMSVSHSDVLDALVALGYSVNEARRALGQIPSDIVDSGDKIRHALKFLAGK
ncbi:Holliday junction branch migration protein RuvA [bacterium]|nr:MAG: Holliday junction branch migration protein RuvA [bacterium]